MTAFMIKLFKTREQGTPPIYYFLLHVQYMHLSYLVKTTAPWPIM